MTISATTLEGSRTNVNDADIASLRSNVRGELVVAGDARYDEARRVWNGNVDRRPALIARCTGAADVQQAVDFARSLGLLVSVRGGGHSAPGYGTNDGGLVIDLSPMKGIRVDPAARTVSAQGGVLWREFDRETQAFGLATTGGTVSNTGIAGLTLGGGLGLADGQARADRRQPDLGRCRHRGRAVPHGERRRTTRICSGRCAAAAAISASSRRSSTDSIRSRRSSAAW